MWGVVPVGHGMRRRERETLLLGQCPVGTCVRESRMTPGSLWLAEAARYVVTPQTERGTELGTES